MTSASPLSSSPGSTIAKRRSASAAATPCASSGLAPSCPRILGQDGARPEEAHGVAAADADRRFAIVLPGDDESGEAEVITEMVRHHLVRVPGTKVVDTG